MVRLNLVNFTLEGLKLLELVLVVLELGVALVEVLQVIIHVGVPQERVLVEVGLEADNLVASALDRARQQQDDLDDFLVAGDPGVEGLALLLSEVFLVPVLDFLGALEHGGSSLVDRPLHIGERRLQAGDVTIKENLHFEEGLEATVLFGAGAAAADALLHLVQRELGSVEESLVHGPVVVLGETDDVLHRDGVHGRVQLVRADGLEEILNSTLNFVVLRAEFLGCVLDPLLLHLDELLERESRALLGEVDKHGLGQGFEVVLDTVLHNIVNVDNELVEFGKALVDVMEEAIDVHRGPGERANTGAESALEVVDVGGKEGAGVGANLVHDADTLTHNILELVVVVLKLLFLEEHDLGRLGNVDSNTGKALGFTDERQDLTVKVDVELEVLEVPNEEGGLEASLCAVDFLLPLLTPHVLVREEGVSEGVVVLHVLADVGGALAHQVLRELLHGDGYPVEEMARPGDGTGYGGQVTHDGWALLVTLVVVLDLLDLSAVLGKEKVIFGLEAILERVAVEDRLEFSEKSQTVNNIGDVGEVLINVFLQLGLNVRNIDVELNKVTVKTVILVLEQAVSLALELDNVSVEDLKDRLDVLKVVLLESLKLLLGAEEVNKLADSTLEQVEAAENFGG